MKIFLAGGTGFVGGHVRRALIDRGHSVRLLVHRRSGAHEAGVEEVEGDATLPASFSGALRGCDAAINLIGIIRERSGHGVTFQRLHVEASRYLVAAAQKAEVRRYLQMSALGATADSSSGYFRSKAAAEEAVRGSGLDWTIFRPSVIFGPKDDFVNQLCGLLRKLPVMPVIGDGSYQMQPIAADDVARCFAGALEKPETVGRTYQLCGPDRMSYNALLDAIGRAIGMQKVRKVNNPVALMRLIVPVMERFPFFPITSDQLTMLLQGSVCDCDWQKTFGFEPTPFETGIRSYLKP